MKYDRGIICGSFDVIHPGYVRMFKDAKRICKHLTIALQGDPTLDRPSKCRPVLSLEDRYEILASIRHVDSIVTYNTEIELYYLLKMTAHDVRILGDDYIGKPHTGDDLGVPVYYHQRKHDYSTTALKEAIYAERKTVHEKNR